MTENADTADPIGVALLRPARQADADSVWGLLDRAGDEIVGMDSLTASVSAAKEMCEETAETIADLATGAFRLEDGQSRRLFFLAVDSATDETLGITGVTFKQAVPNLAVQVATSQDGQGLIMASSSAPWTRTELNSSFLGARARGRGVGSLLSRGRLMMLHLIQGQIPSALATHIRGRFDEDGSAPFWRCFGAHFAPQWATSTEAEKALVDDPTLLGSLAGHRLGLTAPVLDSLGPVNAASLPAFRLLMREGLAPNGMYDPIDGGPTLVGEIAQTATGSSRTHGRVRYGDVGATGASTTDALVSLASVAQFVVIRTSVDATEENAITLDEQTAEAVGIMPEALVALASMEGRASALSVEGNSK